VQTSAIACVALAFSGMRILLAEDNPVNQKLATRLLQRLGAEVQVAANGLEALQALRESEFDAVLMDCQMPQMDGYEATRRLRGPEGQVKNPQIPVIALTAHALATDRTKCLAAGMNDYLTKPINPKHLQEALTKALPLLETRTEQGDPQGAALFDESSLLGRTEGDRDFARDLINLFVRSARETLAHLSTALRDGGDPDVIRKLAHSLKGSAATASAGAMSAACANLERLVGTAQAPAALNSLAAVFALTAAEWERLGWITQQSEDSPPRGRIANDQFMIE
jgi:two-component system, sensor histidine kinase and response regulator